jgi:serine/threonine-protein kinase
MASFLGEIKRRKVFQVAAVYAVVAWLLVQIVATVEAPLNLPDWFATVVIVALAVGFPIALILAWAFDVTPQGLQATMDERPGAPAVAAQGQRLGSLMQALVLLAVGFLVADQYLFTPAATHVAGTVLGDRPVRRFELDLGPTTAIANTTLNTHIAVSRDGRRFAYAINVGGRSQLFLRELNQDEARAVPDSGGAQHPFFSPDGEWVAFFADGTDNELKRVAFRGGPAQPLAEINGAGGGYWGEDGNIVFSTNPEGLRSLLRVPATGGAPEYVIPQPELGADGHVWPAELPGGEALMFVLRPGGNGPIEDGNIALLSLATGEYRVLIRGAHRPQYVPTGHIVFVRAGSLWAVPFDPERLVVTGPELTIIDAVQQNSQIGGAAYAFSNDGLLVYLVGGESVTSIQGTPRSLIWVDRNGREQPLSVEQRAYWQPRLSPDGGRLAIRVGQAPASDIWILDLARGTSSRLTFDASAQHPIWTPDSERVVYYSGFAGTGAMYWQAADGTGQAEQLTTSLIGGTNPVAFSPDGRTLVYQQGEGGVPISDLYLLSMGSQPSSEVLLASGNDDCCAAISPDGRWMAYGTDETGEYEIYVRPFPNVDDGKWQISNGGGTEPRWSASGSELFFLSGSTMYAVPVSSDDDTFAADTPVALFSGSYWDFVATQPNYDVASDGQRFLMMAAAGAPEGERASQQTRLTTVENWFEELRRLAPLSR